MQCPQCHAENREGRRFCGECGLSFASTCPSCGFLNESGEKFCGGCGRSLTLAVRPAEPRLSSPQTYTPKHLAEKILTSKAALEGERKQVTVLFADLKGSMELLADRDPEDARSILDPVLELMMEAVHRYEGTVNQVMGDGIMALFGAPLAHEDHAVRACYAALRMQDAVKRYAEDAQRAVGVSIQIRVGLNSGEVVVRSIGNDLHMDYTAVGQTTNLAARMEQAAIPGSVLLTGDTLRLVEGYVQVASLGPIKIKGLGEPVDAFELTGVGRAQTRLQAATARGLTRFIGREAEMNALSRALERASSGHGQLVAVVGEPGVGKSRLLYEFVRSRRTQQWLVLESGAPPPGKARAGLPIIDFLKVYFQIEAGGDSREIRDRVTGKLFELDRALEPILTPLLVLLDVSIEDPQWHALDPSQRLRLTLDAVRQLLLRVSQSRPLLLVFDDLQAHDSLTQMLMESLVESLPLARILLLASYRPDYRHGWASKTYYTQLRIDPLPPESAEELLRALLGDDPDLQPLRQLLISQTEGNPFFIEESVRTLVETGAFGGIRGAYRLTKDLETIRVPATVEAVLAARIDRLPPEEKRLLQCAAVVGKDVRVSLLRAIADMDEAALRRRLGGLQAAEFLHEARLFPDLEYSFKHALTHEVTYGGLLQDRRRKLHGRIVDTLERGSVDVGQVELLAHHAFRADAWEKAVRYLQQAGSSAASRSAHREAVARFEQALGALEHLPKSREMIECAIDIRFDLRNSLHPLGQTERILDHLRNAETQAAALDDQRRLGQVSSFMCQYYRLMGDLDAAITVGERAVAIARRLGDPQLQIVANSHLGPAFGALGDHRRAVEILTESVDRLLDDSIQDAMGTTGLLSVFCRIYLVCCLAELGEFGAATAYGEEGIRIAETANHLYSLAFACYGVGTLFLRIGDLRRSISLLERGLALCRAANLPLMFPLFGTSLGAAYSFAARSTEAVILLEDTEREAVAMKRMGGHAMLLVRLGETYLRVGRAGDALSCAWRALHLSRAHKEHGHEAYAIRLLAELGSSGDSPDLEKSETFYREAIALAERLGMRPLLAECQLGLGQRHLLAGLRSNAEQLLRTALASFQALGMPFWLARAQEELQRLP